MLAQKGFLPAEPSTQLHVYLFLMHSATNSVFPLQWKLSLLYNCSQALLWRSRVSISVKSFVWSVAQNLCFFPSFTASFSTVTCPVAPWEWKLTLLPHPRTGISTFLTGHLAIMRFCDRKLNLGDRTFNFSSFSVWLKSLLHSDHSVLVCSLKCFFWKLRRPFPCSQFCLLKKSAETWVISLPMWPLWSSLCCLDAGVYCSSKLWKFSRCFLPLVSYIFPSASHHDTWLEPSRFLRFSSSASHLSVLFPLISGEFLKFTF